MKMVWKPREKKHLKTEGVVNGSTMLRGCIRGELGVICWIWAMKDTGNLDLSNFCGMVSTYIHWSR